MAYNFNCNYYVASADSGNGHIFQFYTEMTSHGWTCVNTCYDSGGGFAVTNTISASSDLNTQSNEAPWIILRDGSGAGGVEICLWRSNSYYHYWNVKMSRTAGFTYNASAITDVPTATDEVVLLSGTSMFGSGNSYGAIMVEDVSPWQFYFVSWPTGSFSLDSALVKAELDMGPDTSHPDNNVYIVTNGGANIFENYKTHYPYELSSTGYGKNVAMINSTEYSSVVQLGWVCRDTYGAPNNIPQDSTGDILFPILYGRITYMDPPYGYSGATTMIKWSGTSRSLGDTIDSLNWIVFGDVVLPWDGTTTPSN